ncbi:MAG: hypothetical protein LAT67_05020 [Balneolales bacterium]|nr:hypothetical protein [Balneolales bacterium]
MNPEELKKKSEEEVLDFIRERLSFDSDVISSMRYVENEKLVKEHLRFEMSGFETQTGQSTIFNQSLLNKFADLGIYDYTSYIYLDFHKGSATLYLKYFYENDNHEFDLAGYGTTGIIHKLFQLTIFSGKKKRRRD